MSTLAPLLANTRAMPFPIPLLPPVTMTERPWRDVSMYDCDFREYHDEYKLALLTKSASHKAVRWLRQALSSHLLDISWRPAHWRKARLRTLPGATTGAPPTHRSILR